MNNQQDYLKRLTSLRDALERKPSDFDDAKNRSIEAAKLGIQELRILTDFVENSILREIEESFEVNRFANALNNLDLILSEEGANDNSNEFELDKIQKLVNESIPAFLGPSKRDFLKGQETIIGLNNWYNKRSLYLPKHIEGRSLGSDCVELVWDKVEGAMGYHVEMRYPNEGSFHCVYEGCETRYKLSGLCSGTRVLFRLRSVVGNGGVSEWSECVEASTAPTASQHLCAEGKSEYEITLYWDKVDVSDGNELPIYHVEMRSKRSNDDATGFKEVYCGNENKCTVKGLESEEEYLFYVRTECGGRYINKSSVATGRTKIPIPKNFRVKADNWNEMSLSWDSVVSKTGTPMNYIVEMKKENENDSRFTEIYKGTKTNFTRVYLKQNTEYSFRVRSMCGSEMSEWSDIVKDKTQKLFALSNFRATTITSDSITLTWDGVSIAEFYQIEVNEKVLDDQIKTNSFTKKGLFPSTEYIFRTRTVKGSEESEWSDVLKVKTMEAPDFSECVWKECPDDVGQDKRKNSKEVKHGKAHFPFKGSSDDNSYKYSVDENNPKIATKIANSGYCTIIGNAPLPLNKLTSWNIKILNSKDNNGYGIYIGVASFNISQNERNDFEKCGWYFDCYSSLLLSGPPHNYSGKGYGIRKKDGEYIRMGDSIGVVMDTTKGEISFAVNGVNLGVAYEGISFDKPLVPCVILYYEGDSVELDLSEVKESVNSSILIPSSITAKSGTWDSITLTWDFVEGASFYQVEIDEKLLRDVFTTNKVTKTGLLADSEHSFRVRAASENSVGKWSDVVKKRTLKKTFECSGWKECPDNVNHERIYYIDENNPRITKTSNHSSWNTIIGNTPLPLNKLTSWSIKVSASRYNNDYLAYIGVAPFYINQGDDNNYYKCGWYINFHDLTLISGPPHEYRNKKYAHNLCKQTQTGDLTGVIMDTTKGNISFISNKKNLGMAYEGVPLDKPLIPCVIAKGRRSDLSIELII